MRDQDDAHAVEFAFDLGGLNRTTADDAGAPGPSVGFRDAIDGGQATLGEPGADLTPQVVVGAAIIHHDADAAPTGPFARRARPSG
jgi:hypothetical protein